MDRIIGLGQDITHMVVASPDGGVLYTANIGSDSVTAIDRRTGKLTMASVAKQPEGLAASPDGKEIWAGSRAAGEVSIIAAAAMKPVETIAVPCPAYRLLFTPDGKRVLIPDMAGQALVMVNAASRKVAKIIPVGGPAGGVITDRAGKTAYVALSGGGRVVSIDLESLTATGKIAVGSISAGIDWGEEGRD